MDTSLALRAPRFRADKNNKTQGDTCDGVLEVYNYITRDQFFQWNPALTENCNGLLPGYYYCVASFAPTALPMPPTQTAGATPTASGITGECRAWYMAVGVENCASIALSFGTFSESGKPLLLQPFPP